MLSYNQYAVRCASEVRHIFIAECQSAVHHEARVRALLCAQSEAYALCNGMCLTHAHVGVVALPRPRSPVENAAKQDFVTFSSLSTLSCMHCRDVDDDALHFTA